MGWVEGTVLAEGCGVGCDWGFRAGVHAVDGIVGFSVTS